MDGGKDWLDSEILRTGRCLLEMFRKALCPNYVRDEDLILFTAPWEETDYRVGVYLYDVQDYSVMPVSERVISDSERRFPPKAVELSYMVYCNESHRFGGVQREQMQTVLNEIVRTVHDHPFLEKEGGESFQCSFLRESIEFKMSLWGSFNRPLQPAVYIKAAPVLIESGRIRRVSPVKERDYEVENKKQ